MIWLVILSFVTLGISGFGMMYCLAKKYQIDKTRMLIYENDRNLAKTIQAMRDGDKVAFENWHDRFKELDEHIQERIKKT